MIRVTAGSRPLPPPLRLDSHPTDARAAALAPMSRISVRVLNGTRLHVPPLPALAGTAPHKTCRGTAPARVRAAHITTLSPLLAWSLPGVSSSSGTSSLTHRPLPVHSTCPQPRPTQDPPPPLLPPLPPLLPPP
eukprot:811124-Rhodomonas_salina.1